MQAAIVRHLVPMNDSLDSTWHRVLWCFGCQVDAPQIFRVLFPRPIMVETGTAVLRSTLRCWFATCRVLKDVDLRLVQI